MQSGKNHVHSLTKRESCGRIIIIRKLRGLLTIINYLTM